eukprot:gb/GECH01002760.1/.p1 GENE.gb/GECH01002760.1/~~gb/GECH01002760.1/.p1  ORF type:complete len:526 (+),score=152.57 gb/GECH01002760.1/:1-1578(+)
MSTDTKEQRYDRQCRLWGTHGQKHIESSNLLVLNASATSSELLKNLVLPGVGRFTLVDGEKVTERDFGNNFFVSSENEGKARAQVVTDLLKELNPYVEGHCVEESPKKIIEEKPEFFNDFTFVVATQLDEATLRKLGRICSHNRIPLLVARSYGLIGHLRVVSPPHDIVETRLDMPTFDLRITKPFPELKEYALNNPVSEMSSYKEHSHTPYVVILIQSIEKWKSKHDGNLPKTREEKNEFKALLKNSAWDYQDELNFKEAVSQAWRCFSNYSLPFEVKKIINDSRADNVTNDTPDFWVLVNALRAFVDQEGTLPLMGNIPDMNADSKRYLELQKIYTQKAKRDRDTLASIAEESCKKSGRQSVDSDLIDNFCKNAAALRSVRFRTIEEEMNTETSKKDELSMHLMDPHSVVPFYLLLRACDSFFSKNGRFPGEHNDEDLSSDFESLKEIFHKLLSDLGLSCENIPDEYILEMARYGGAELHNIAALIGGIGAQEVIKMMTNQRVPLNNTYVYCGVNCSGMPFEA